MPGILCCTDHEVPPFIHACKSMKPFVFKNINQLIDSDSDSDNVYSTKIDTNTISGLQNNITIYNNHIFLIYNARWETPIKVISDTRRGIACTRSERIHNAIFWRWGCVPRRPAPGPPLRHPYYRRDSRTHLRAWHPHVKYTGARSANESQCPDPSKVGIPAMAAGGTLHIG